MHWSWTAPSTIGLLFAAALLAVAAVVSAVERVEDRTRHSERPSPSSYPATDRVSPLAEEADGRGVAILRRHWWSIAVIALGAILLLVHLPHGLYVVGTLLLAAIVLPTRYRMIRGAWQNKPIAKDP